MSDGRQVTLVFNPFDMGDPPEQDRTILVDTGRTGLRRWLVCHYKRGEWITPGTTSDKVISVAKTQHSWSYL